MNDSTRWQSDINRPPHFLILEAFRTQQDLAKKVGVSRQTIASIEANRYNPSLILAFEISFVFDKELQEVFQYELVEEKS
ncbi:helix-turn-helix transcriptional regulator [Paenibacillus naphthalenovorans]|uniref:helix-turn-helix transcriptional regulator n=1 Tax=Paenibacillus naphthalenovorans TaxID=162209 RepID=UPI003D284B9D